MIGSILRLAALVGAFLIYVTLSPAAPGNPALAIALFVGSAIVFRVLSSFESSSE
jgi:hypothetical protein